MSKYRVLLALLLVFSLGCGLLGGNGDDGDTAGSGGDTSQGGGGGGDENGGDAQIEELAGVDSYRMSWEWGWTPDGGDAEVEGWVQEYTRDPGAYRISYESGGSTYEFVQIEDTAWYCFDDSCAQSEMSAEDAASSFGMSLDTMTPDESDMDYEGRETVNGISTRHYRVNLAFTTLAALAQGDVSDISSEVWLADESDLPSFVVKYETSWRETRGEQEGEAYWSYQVYDINEPITIEPPEGAAQWPDDVPSYAGATDVMLMGGLITFTTGDDVATVLDYYESGLASNGWTQTSDNDYGAMVTQDWAKGAETLTLMVSAENGSTSVVINLS
jgi:hypothetical protein